MSRRSNAITGTIVNSRYSLHELAGQNKCSFCGKRFKSKNEAWRHESSLHVRRRFWTCFALSRYEDAFHDSLGHSRELGVCCYCGEEFPRNRHATGSRSHSDDGLPLQATKNGEERRRHLHDVHKFQCCIFSKKFYRRTTSGNTSRIVTPVGAGSGWPIWRRHAWWSIELSQARRPAG